MLAFRAKAIEHKGMKELPKSSTDNPKSFDSHNNEQWQCLPDYSRATGEVIQVQLDCGAGDRHRL